MGFFDGKADTAFDKTFDFNHDGYMNSTEWAMQFMFLDEVTKEEKQPEQRAAGNTLTGSSYRHQGGIDTDFDTNSNTDPDFDELADMDEDERREALEEAGYDPDDFEDQF